MSFRTFALALAGQLFFTGCAVVAPLRRTVVHSSKTGIVVSFKAPSGFEGPTHQAWPSHREEWSFDRDDCGCTMTLRLGPTWPNSAQAVRSSLSDTDAAITQALRKQWQTPKVRTIGFVEVAGRPVRIRATYHVAGQEASGDLFVGRSYIAFELFTETEAQLSEHIPAFLSFVRSVRVEHQ